MRRCSIHITYSARLLAASVAFILLTASSAFAQLEHAFDAHGSLKNWERYGSVEFDQTWTSAKGVKKTISFSICGAAMV